MQTCGYRVGHFLCCCYTGRAAPRTVNILPRNGAAKQAHDIGDGQNSSNQLKLLTACVVLFAAYLALVSRKWTRARAYYTPFFHSLFSKVTPQKNTVPRFHRFQSFPRGVHDQRRPPCMAMWVNTRHLIEAALLLAAR